jgi:UDP-N-acetylglucosamine 2-epimerase (non-hydrolysing)
MRENTERPITITEGTNILVGRDKGKIIFEVMQILNGKSKHFKIPKFWDGKTAERIVRVLREQKK